MLTVDLVQAKDQLGSLLDIVQGGEEVIITRHGHPVARVSAVTQLKEPVRPLGEFRARMPRWRKSSACLLREVRDEAL